jgi:hypothetical protein
MATTRFSYVWLLPLLERPRHGVEADLQAALHALAFEQRVDASEVSLREVISTALNGSDYWARRAADWLEDGFPLDAALVEQIDSTVKSNRWEQSTLHRLWRLARRFDRTRPR